MASAAEAAGDASTSAPEAREKPVVVRVKCKPSQTRPDAFYSNAKEIKSKTKEWNDRIKRDKKQDQLHSAARQRHEDLGRNARFAQIWRSRKGDKNEADESLRELCRLYDAVQVDSDGEKHPAEPWITSFEQGAILWNFLPLLREHLPLAAEEIESDIISLAQSEDSDVYDIYTVKEADDANMEDTSAAPYPLLQVDDDDDECYNDDEYLYDTDDSNAENNPLYDYPEEPSEDEVEDANAENPFTDIHGSGSEYEKEVVEEDDEDEYWR